MLDAIEHIQRKLKGISLGAFEEDDDRRRIVERCFEVISEASRRLPDAFKDRYPEIPWKKIGAHHVFQPGALSAAS
jgi:uncharacterized protein with HEPN domain